MDGLPAHLGQKIDPETERVEVDGVPLPVRPDLVYYLLFKPPGVITTTDDPHGRDTVVGLVPETPRVVPVGRLDADSEGLLLLTNDGDLTHVVTHPSFGVTKTYLVRCQGVPTAADIALLRGGVDLADGPARALEARLIDALAGEALVEVVMGEGRNREVRRMFDVIGHAVTRLVRTSIGPLSDRTLRPGTWRHLTVDEVRRLYAAATPS